MLTTSSIAKIQLWITTIVAFKQDKVKKALVDNKELVDQFDSSSTSIAVYLTTKDEVCITKDVKLPGMNPKKKLYLFSNSEGELNYYESLGSKYLNDIIFMDIVGGNAAQQLVMSTTNQNVKRSVLTVLDKFDFKLPNRVSTVGDAEEMITNWKEGLVQLNIKIQKRNTKTLSEEIEFWDSIQSTVQEISDMVNSPSFDHVSKLLEQSPFQFTFTNALEKLAHLQSLVACFIQFSTADEWLTLLKGTSPERKDIERAIAYIPKAIKDSLPLFISSGFDYLPIPIIAKMSFEIDSLVKSIHSADFLQQDAVDAKASLHYLRAVLLKYVEYLHKCFPDIKSESFEVIKLSVLRVDDILDIIGSQDPYSRLEKIEVGGVKYESYNFTITSTFQSYGKLFDELKSKSLDLLDTGTSSVSEDLNLFFKSLKLLDAQISDVIHNNCNEYADIYMRFRVLEIFESFLSRPNVIIALDKFTKKLVVEFNTCIQTIYTKCNEINAKTDWGSNPPVMTAIIQLHYHTLQVQELRSNFKRFTNDESFEVYTNKCNELLSIISVFIHQHWTSFLLECQNNIQFNLNVYLMTIASNSLTVNIHPNTLLYLHEIRLFKLYSGQLEQYKLQTNAQVDQFYEKQSIIQHSIRLLRKSCSNYNSFIASMDSISQYTLQTYLDKLQVSIDSCTTELTWKHDLNHPISVLWDAIDAVLRRYHLLKQLKHSIQEEADLWLSHIIIERKCLTVADAQDKQDKLLAIVKQSQINWNQQFQEIQSSIISNLEQYIGELDKLMIQSMLQYCQHALTIIKDSTMSNEIFLEISVAITNHIINYTPHYTFSTENSNTVFTVADYLFKLITETSQHLQLFQKHSEQTLYDRIFQNPLIIELKQQIFTNLEQLKSPMDIFHNELQIYAFLYDKPRQQYIDEVMQKKSVELELNKLQNLNIKIKELKNECFIVGFVRLDTRIYKTYIISCLKKTLSHLLGQFEKEFQDQLKHDLQRFKEQQELLNKEMELQDSDLLLLKIKCIQELNSFDKQKETYFTQLENTLIILKNNNMVDDTSSAVFNEVKQSYSTTSKCVVKTTELIAPATIVVKENIASKMKRLNRKILTFREDFLVKGPFNYVDNFSYDLINTCYTDIHALLQEKKELGVIGDVLEINSPNSDVLDACLVNLKQLKLIWDTCCFVLDKFDQYKAKEYKQLDLEQVEQYCKDVLKDLKKMDKEIKSWGIYQHIEQQVKSMASQISLINELKNPFIMQRHWDQIMVISHTSLVMHPRNTLQELLTLQLHQYEDQVQTIIDKANKEQSIQKVLNDIGGTWKQMTLIFEQKSISATTSVYLIKLPDTLVETLEDNQMVLQNLLNSKNIDHFKHAIMEWQQTLSTLDTVTTLLNGVQTTWSHLQSIFNQSEDIKEQLPEDTNRFQATSQQLIQLINDFYDAKCVNAVQLCSTPLLVVKLEEFHKNLQKCEKALSDYLETKRLVFPRFYFISSADLLDILSNGNTPRLVSQHLSKLFDNLCDLEFINENLNCNIVKGMYSREKEYVEFNKPVALKGAVENWLCDLESEMKACLKSKLSEAISLYDEKPREKWILEHCSQLALAGTQIFWTSEVNLAFAKLEEGNETAMKDYYKKQCAQLTNLIALTQGQLTKNDRTLVMTICTLDVHARDVVGKLINEKATSSQCWSWQSQLRLRWDDNEQDCLINICDAKFRYNYEYLGNTPRLVVTPLTDRCYITLSQALHLKLGGSPQGPAGTGKTETVKDLGKAMAIMVYVFNCSEQMDYQSVGNIYKGLAQSGSWGCFDEFNRISVEVLSVIATQVKSIQDALRAKKNKFNFLGEEIVLKSTVGIWITMNPGYAGRAELPDNLKALFRPCSMVVPNLELIMEIMLMAEGFTTANTLARKFNALYKLNRELLSKQDHYDWGLRAIKSVLVVAGSLKRSEPSTTPEDQVLMRALRDFNTPKIVLEDMPIFMGLIADLFPKLQVTRKRDLQLEQEIIASAIELGLQPEDSFILKVVQLEELLQVRHCVFILGDAATGKSKIIKTLFKAYHRLGRKCSLADLDPKAVTNDELFGFMNPSTREWKDGLFSTVMRDFANGNNDPKWILLDGDIDPMWIESLNTVMDDNKVLTLASNERIPLKNNMRLLFEIGDLKYATPATVSRAGILFVSQSDVSLNAVINSYVQKREDANCKAILSQLFDKYTTICLEMIKKVKHCDIMPFNMVNTLFRFLDHFLQLLDSKPIEKECIESIFAFSSIWAYGGCVIQDQVDNRTEMSKMFKAEFVVLQPIESSVFDVFYDINSKSFKHWDSLMFESTPNEVIFDSMVPITETIRQYYLMDILIKHGHPTLLVGGAGVGKSSLIKQKLQHFSDTHSFTNIPFNYYTNSTLLQPILEKPLEKKVGRTFGPVGSKKLIYFIDDLNMPEVDKYGTVSCHTLMRQHLDYSHWYDRAKMQLKDIVNAQYICAMNPTSGNFTINKRLQRHFSILYINGPSDLDLQKIYSTLLSTCHDSLKPFIPKIVSSVLSIHKKISSVFIPTAIKFHYIFTMRELSNVFQGILASDKELATVNGIIMLLYHECQRVYGDRLITKEDVESCSKLTLDILQQEFNEKLSNAGVICTFAKGLGDGKYTSATVDVAKKVIQEGLVNYNELFSEMNLVLFEDAVKHVCRINRILDFNRGNIVLVGVGGSGKASVTRLASYIASKTIYQISLKKGYSFIDFKLELAQLFIKCGIKKQQITLLMTEPQIVDEKMLIVINDFLASGEVPQLFTDEEIQTIYNGIRSEVKQLGLMDTNENCWSKFIDNVKLNLRFVICLSPVGDKLRRRCRRFPALMSTYINWFQNWPEEALLSVAERFIEDMELVTADLRPLVSKFMCFWQMQCELFNKKFLLNDKRYNYATPKSYLEFIKLFKLLLEKKSNELLKGKERLENGLNKLKSTSEQVDILKSKLAEQEIDLKIKNENAEKLISTVAENTIKVNHEKKLADEEEQKVSEITIVVEEKKRSCEQDLKAAEPALAAAKDALNTLNKSNLTELKSFGSPSQEVVDVVASVLILLSPANKIIKDKSWKASKVAMANVDRFLDSLVTFNKEAIDKSNLEALQPYLSNPNFNVDVIKGKSLAAAGLCGWVINIVIYYHVFCDVEPKRKALEEANEQLLQAQTKLQQVKSKVQQLDADLMELKMKFENATSDKLKCEMEAKATQDTLSLADRLVNGLSGERTRWGDSIQYFTKLEQTLVGDVLLSSAFLSCSGPFTKSYRMELIELFKTQLKQLGIPNAADFDVCKFLANDADIATWNNEGLPRDPVSIENALMYTNSSRWCLFIDPQLQCINWLKNRLVDAVIIRIGQKGYLDKLEKCISEGECCILEDVGEYLDPMLDNIISNNKIKKQKYYMLGDKEVEVHSKFKLILQTRLPNPHYTPEVQAQTCLINFTVTKEGLEDQLLADVVNVERSELEQSRAELTKQQNEFRIKLVELENTLLNKLSSAQGNFLGDTTLVENLETTKKTAIEIEQKVKEAIKTEAKINETREIYRPVASRSSMLYFLLNSLWIIHPMYQYSLKSFKNVFFRAISKSETAEEPKDRVKNLIETITFEIYSFTSRGLFESDKLIFVSQMVFNIMLKDQEIDPIDLDYLLKGPRDSAQSPVAWIPDPQWQSFKALSKIESLKELCMDIESSNKRWKKYAELEAPENDKLPGDWKNKSQLQQLSILRALRPDRIVYGLKQFINAKIGEKYTNGSRLPFAKTFEESSPTIPIFFILSPGVDPVKDVELVGKTFNIGIEFNNFYNISLGQGQEVVAEKALELAAQQGGWVMLQNIHLVAKWLPLLEKKLEELFLMNLHPNFRVFLSAEPAADPLYHIIPTFILQTSIKITNEAPTGMKANLHKALDNFNQEQLERCSKELEFKSILFALCYFHAVVVERKKFGAIGWNRSYPFSNGDLTISVDVLFNYLEAFQKIPWDDIRYIFGEIMYGGHISDDLDRKLCAAYLQVYIKEELFDTSLQFSPQFNAPPNLEYMEYHRYIDEQLPLESPLLYGMHPNAEINVQTIVSEKLFTSMLELQPKDQLASTGMTREEKLKSVLEEMVAQCPEGWQDLNSKIEEKSPYTSVCLQECDRMNLVLKLIKQSCQECLLGLKGDLGITDVMDTMMSAVVMNKVPEQWSKLTFASTLGLNLWFLDILQRYKQLEGWAGDFNVPSCVNLSLLFNPQAFLTAVMQTTARKNEWPLDKMTLMIDVLKKQREEITTGPRDGIYMDGLILEGARYEGGLVDSKMKELYFTMPVIHVKAVPIDKADTSGYACPIYRTKQRGPTYIWTLNLKSKEIVSKWVLGGVAMLLSQ